MYVVYIPFFPKQMLLPRIDARLHGCNYMHARLQTPSHAIKHQFWATTFTHGHRYDMLSDNVVECTNSFLKDTPSAPNYEVTGRDTCKIDGILSKKISSSTNHYFTTNSIRKEVPL